MMSGSVGGIIPAFLSLCVQGRSFDAEELEEIEEKGK